MLKRLTLFLIFIIPAFLFATKIVISGSLTNSRTHRGAEFETVRCNVYIFNKSESYGSDLFKKIVNKSETNSKDYIKYTFRDETLGEGGFYIFKIKFDKSQISKNDNSILITLQATRGKDVYSDLEPLHIIDIKRKNKFKKDMVLKFYGLIKGTITQKYSDEPINNAKIYFIPVGDYPYLKTITTSTKNDGTYEIPKFLAGSYYIKINPKETNYIPYIDNSGKFFRSGNYDFTLGGSTDVVVKINSENKEKFKGVIISLFDAGTPFRNSLYAKNTSENIYTFENVPYGAKELYLESPLNEKYVLDNKKIDVSQENITLEVNLVEREYEFQIQFDCPDCTHPLYKDVLHSDSYLYAGEKKYSIDKNGLTEKIIIKYSDFASQVIRFEGVGFLGVRIDKKKIYKRQKYMRIRVEPWFLIINVNEKYEWDFNKRDYVIGDIVKDAEVEIIFAKDYSNKENIFYNAKTNRGGRVAFRLPEHGNASMSISKENHETYYAAWFDSMKSYPSNPRNEMTVSLPKLVSPFGLTDYNQGKIKKYLDSASVDYLEGIYEQFTLKEKYTVGIIKNEKNIYDIIYLNTTGTTGNWKKGYIKGTMEKIPNQNNLYKVKWAKLSGELAGDGYGGFDANNVLGLTLPSATLEFLKIYPFKSSPKAKNTEPVARVKGTGSGFLISNKGIVATNYHVIDNAEKIEVFFPTTEKTYKCDVLIENKKDDIALLRLKNFDYTDISSRAIPYSIGDRNSIKVGKKIFSLGYPLSGVLGKDVKLSDGLITSKSGIESDYSVMQIDAPIQPGNSGGPLFSHDGELVGLIVASYSQLHSIESSGTMHQNVNFAIKVNRLVNMIEELDDAEEILNRKNRLYGHDLSKQIEILKPITAQIRTY